MKGLHQIDLGQWPPALFVTKEEGAYKRLLRRYCGKDAETNPFPQRDAGFCQHLSNGLGADIFVVVVGRQSNRTQLIATIAHEATHAMRWILESVGEKAPGTETEAYLVGHIVKGALRALTK